MASAGVVWPLKTRELETRLMDSRRWNAFPFRDGDIVVDTWAKSGTTWMQEILAQLILGAPDALVGQAISPWVDMALIPLDQLVGRLEAQTHRRVLKSHLPLDALVYSPRAKYIFVGRDVRDIAWSLHNHQSSYSDFFLELINDRPDSLGPKMSRPTCGVRDFYLRFIDTGGVFGPEAGAAYGGDVALGSFWDHAESFWSRRDLPNLLFVHFARLKADLAGEIRRIAGFLDMPLDEDLLDRVVEHCGLEHMRRAVEADPEADAGIRMTFNGGAAAFFHKGTNGRWKDVLTAEESALADDVAGRLLSADCARWLKSGGMAQEGG
jgi:aryl sulfotransferase